MIKTGHIVRHTFRLSGKAWLNYELEREAWLYFLPQYDRRTWLGWKVQRAAGRDQRAVGSCLTCWLVWYVRGLGGDRPVVTKCTAGR